MFFIEPIRNFYGRFERQISSFALVLGFIVDSLTLRRVDTPWENFWILLHLIAISVFIILIHIKDSTEGDETNPSKRHFWYVTILQFFFGGIFSAYLVFYFRSTDIFATWPFLALLTLAFIANESFKKHYVRFSFQVSLFFLSIYSFAIFLVPVVLHQIGVKIFLLSGLLSLILISIFILILFHFIKDKSPRDRYESKKMIALFVSGIFILVNFLYFTKLIPPIPLSLKDVGTYHSLQRIENGNYAVTYEDHGWQGYFKLYKDFHQTPGSPVYVYSAIFSPKGLNLNIRHEWQHYDEIKKEWQTKSVINLPVVGGRDGGFRTYSTRSNLEAGKWRVSIENELGHTIGHARFNIIKSEIPPVLKFETKD